MIVISLEMSDEPKIAEKLASYHKIAYICSVLLKYYTKTVNKQ